MKRVNWNLIAGVILVAVIGIAGCKKKIEGELGDPFDKVEGISGTWELQAFIQKDLNNPIKEERDLSEFYIEDGVPPMQITFSSDRTYSVAITEGKNYFGDEGDWRFDDFDYPSMVILETEEDTLEFDLGTIVREYDSQLQMELPRGCNLDSPEALPTVVYRFVFNRTNP